MELREVVSAFAVRTIRDGLVVGVADAEAHYKYSRADEDALTGALGQAIASHGAITVTSEDGEYTVRMYYRKIRGRGPGAPEKPLGADGIFQVEVLNSAGQAIWRKGLPFQAKKDWTGSDPRLVTQARSMIENAEQGLVIDFSSEGYRACPASVAVEHGGHGGTLRTAGLMEPLGQVLGNDFLNCDIGVEGLFYDPEAEDFGSEDTFHVIGATVKQVRD